MFIQQCELSKVDRIFRVVLGLLCLIGCLLGFRDLYFVILGSVAICSGVFSICCIPSILK